MSRKARAAVCREHNKPVVVETIDGERAAGSRYAQALRDVGFKGMGTGLRWYAGLR